MRLRERALSQQASATFWTPLERRMLRAQLRSLAKTPGLTRMRLRSSAMVTSRTWWEPHESPHFFTTALAALGAGFVEDLVQSKLEHGRGEGGSVGRASDQSTVVRQCGVWA